MKLVIIHLSACNFAIVYLYKEIKFKPTIWATLNRYFGTCICTILQISASFQSANNSLVENQYDLELDFKVCFFLFLLFRHCT